MNIIFAGLAVAALSTGAASGVHRGSSVDESLARAIAAAAFRAETGLPPYRIRDAAASAGAEVITTWGDPPHAVQQSLEWVLEVCPGEEAQRLGYNCPTSAQSYQGLGDLLARVAKLADQPKPAEGRERAGDAPFGPIPDFTGGGGGADYRGAP